jgi:hypothetical protein
MPGVDRAVVPGAVSTPGAAAPAPGGEVGATVVASVGEV